MDTDNGNPMMKWMCSLPWVCVSNPKAAKRTPIEMIGGPTLDCLQQGVSTYVAMNIIHSFERPSLPLLNSDPMEKIQSTIFQFL